MSVTTQDTPGQSAPTPSEKAMALLASAGVKTDAGSDQKATTGAGTPADAAATEVTVDWGGATRKVPLKDLVAAAMEKEKTAQMQQLVDDRLKLLGNAEALTDLHGRLQKLTPDQKRRMLAVIEGQPDVDDEPAPETDSMDDIVDAVAPAARNGKVKANPLESRLAQTEGAIREIAQLLLADQQSKEVTREQTKATDILSSFPELARDENARSFIVEWVRQARTINPRADVEDLVTKAAQRLQKIREGGSAAAFGEVMEDQRTGPVRLPPVNDGKPFTADDMAKGKTREAVTRLLKSLR